MTAGFEAVKAAYLGQPGIGTKRMFGAEGLSVNDHFFAMEYKGRIVVKLPATRVAELIAAGQAEPWGPSPGRVMKEWATLHEETDAVALAREAQVFVAQK